MYLPLVANLIAQLFFVFFFFLLGICCVARLYFSYQSLYNLHSIYSSIGLYFISLWYDRLLGSLTFIDLTLYILYNWINLNLIERKGEKIEEGNPSLWLALHLCISFFVLYNESQITLILVFFDRSCCDFWVAPKRVEKLFVERANTLYKT